MIQRPRHGLQGENPSTYNSEISSFLTYPYSSEIWISFVDCDFTKSPTLGRKVGEIDGLVFGKVI